MIGFDSTTRPFLSVLTRILTGSEEPTALPASITTVFPTSFALANGVDGEISTAVAFPPIT